MWLLLSHKHAVQLAFVRALGIPFRHHHHWCLLSHKHAVPLAFVRAFRHHHHWCMLLSHKHAVEVAFAVHPHAAVCRCATFARGPAHANGMLMKRTTGRCACA